jgi:hypothetical protein
MCLADRTPENFPMNLTALTPKARMYRRKCLHLEKYIRRRNKTNFKHRIKGAEKFADSLTFVQATKGLSKIQRDFFKLQLKSCNLQPKGRRFTERDKVLALTLLKQSGRGYKFLSKLFTLPSIRTLQTLLSSVPISTGISGVIISQLKSIVSGFTDHEKYYTLMWDEMSLQPHLDYNKKSDLIEGFEDFGHLRSKKIADHVLVFMIRSVAGNKKQPIAYYYCESATKSAQLVRCIKEVYKAVVSTGMHCS